jgi:hypothetical protein
VRIVCLFQSRSGLSEPMPFRPQDWTLKRVPVSSSSLSSRLARSPLVMIIVPSSVSTTSRRARFLCLVALPLAHSHEGKHRPLDLPPWPPHQITSLPLQWVYLLLPSVQVLLSWLYFEGDGSLLTSLCEATFCWK